MRFCRVILLCMPLLGCEREGKPDAVVAAKPADTRVVRGRRSAQVEPSIETESVAAVASAKPVTPDPQTLRRLREWLKAAATGEGGEGSSSCDRSSFDEIGDEQFLACLSEILRRDDPSMRLQALLLVGARFGLNADDATDASPSVEHAVVETVSAGLADGDENVRQAAYDVMRVLGPDESGILAGRLMRGEDTALKVALLEEVAGLAGDLDVRYSLMALEGKDPSVRNLAVENLEDLTGEVFESVDAALDWRESHGSWSALAPSGRNDDR